MKFAELAGRVLPLLMGISATAAQEDLALGSWHCIGPFKDEAFGNIARSLETRFGPEVDTFGDDPADEGLDPVNLAVGARASSPDGIPAEKASDAPAAAVDGNPATYWDDRDGADAYVLRLTFPEPRTFNELAMVGWRHHLFSPRAFTVVCDGRELAAVDDAVYTANEYRLPLPETRASRLELRISAAYGGSPAIRELALYHRTPPDPGDEPAPGRPDLTQPYRMAPFPGYLDLDRAWAVRPDWTDGYHNLLPRGPPPSRNESVYLYRTLTAPSARVVTAHLRCKDFYKVWLNGRLVARQDRLDKDSTLYPRPQPIRLPLGKGENHLLIKNTVRWAERGFSFAIEGRHDVIDRRHLDINRFAVRSPEDARAYVEAFKFKPTPIPMYSPAVYRIDEYLKRFPASPDAAAYDARLAELEARQSPTPDFARELEATLTAEAGRLPPLLFILHPPSAVNAIAPYENPGATPSSICLFDPTHPDEPPRVIFHHSDLRIYDMSLSFDAGTVFFSAKADGPNEFWQIYSVGIDGSNPTRITHTGSHNISPCELPDGRLAFISTRQGTFVVCQTKRTGLLFTTNRDGSDARLISGNIDSDHTPRVTNDGRILFTRWDYGIEKNVFARHALWTVDPDGTHLQLFFGNTIEDPAGFWSPMPIPGRPEVVCVFGPHHNYHAGMIGLVWNGLGTESPRGDGYRWITRERPVYGDHTYPDGYQDPYPINEKQFVCSYGGASARRKGPDGKPVWAPLNLVYLDAYGNQRILYRDPDGLSCHQPIPVRPRPRPPVIPTGTPPAPFAYRDPETQNRTEHQDGPTATLLVQDIYRGISAHVARGEAAYIAVLEQVRKSRRLSGGEAWGHSPIIGRGTVHARRLVGLVPIEPDGSAHFTVPALRSISLNVLNAEGKTLMRMGSDMHTMPGERLSCIGCHEVREGGGQAGRAPDTRAMPVAAARDPVAPVPPESGWGTEGLIDYIQVVQPVWDRHCIPCHQGPKPDGQVNLTADRTRFFCQSYDHLVDRDIVDHLSVFSLDHDEGTPNTTGAMVSRIDPFLDEAHTGAALSWEERFRVYCWIDANVPYYGTYDSELVAGAPRGLGMRDAWETGNRSTPWATRDLQGVFDRRCLDCHRRTVLNQSWLMPVEMVVASNLWGDKALTSHGFGTKWKLVNKLGPEFRINLTHPTHSSLLNAPLAENQGGLGLCRNPDGSPVFPGRTDPDFQTMLTAIQAGAARLESYPRVDMLGRDRLLNPARACFELAADPDAALADAFPP